MAEDRKPDPATVRRANLIARRLAEAYPEATTDLKFSTPFELMVAVILSAQSTDAQVNKITAKLFKKYRTPEDFARLTPEQLAEDIKGCGLFRNKSKFIVEASKILVDKYGGKVPENRETLEKLPGVGRKTANVILGVAFGHHTFPVDTHVHRVARRLGLSQGKTPEQTEQDLCALFPPELWQRAHHQIIYHGRRVCDARNPRCWECCLKELCPTAGKQKGENK
ncbi:endonuclease III [Desulfotomaculum nigrificans CO-1-SRB]|uniref:Endonuclease III n=1 Tax=Desulfotomaculum nigrificans (strain DSM 14880 / VKM B-2319 / CO-1-SRB) TaxID=868595 RepID=F6B7L0_DESCC|nr:endonuclease III [Desulfotomaculum nigrificans]AEF94564.1 endonuclease III [Desulfotomaculum nigrificans CO-1-SRB]